MPSRGLSAEEGPLRVASKHAEKEQEELWERLPRVLSTEQDAKIMHAACEFVCLFVWGRACVETCLSARTRVCMYVCERERERE